MEINRENLAWCGGFFEGEGSICTQRNTLRRKSSKDGKKRYINLSISSTDKESLVRFQKGIGGLGQLYGPYLHKSSSPRKPIWQWRCNKFESAQAVIGFIWPWLNSRRKDRVEEVLALIASGRDIPMQKRISSST